MGGACGGFKPLEALVTAMLAALGSPLQRPQRARGWATITRREIVAERIGIRMNAAEIARTI
jgi:hypothetical protein